MIWIKIGSLLMFLGVALGAFGSHALRGRLDAHSMEIFKTGVLYHFLHALALFAVAWITTHGSYPRANWAGVFFVCGIILFSGSLYILSVTGLKWLGAITPLGGMAFLAGWALLFFK